MKFKSELWNKCVHPCLLKGLLVISLGFVSITSSAQSYSTLVFDKHQSQYAGANDLITLHHALYSFQDRYIPDTLKRENTFLRKSVGFGYRAVRLWLLDAQADELIALVQHEAFGHGARFREYGYIKNSFNLNLFFPFGNGSGFAHSGTQLPGYHFPTQLDNIVISIGGVDAQILLANTVVSQALLDDTLHYRQGLLYLLSQNNQFAYLARTYERIGKKNSGNDMTAYVNGINFLYGLQGDQQYTIRKQLTADLVSFINPFQLYAAYSILYTYGIKGQKQLNKIPMIRIGKVRYLPAVNYSFTPFGSQYHFMNYVRYRHMLFSGDLMAGKTPVHSFYGFSAKGFNVIDVKAMTLNLHLDLWEQPELHLENSLKPTTHAIGGALKADLLVRPVSLPNKAGLFIQAGYKTRGYLMGEALDRGFILRGGIGMHL